VANALLKQDDDLDHPPFEQSKRRANMSHLLDRFDLEFFGIPPTAHTFSLNDLLRQNWTTSLTSFGPTFPRRRSVAMKRKRFPAEQIVSILRQAELGMAVSDIVRQLGISEQTFYRWKKQYAGMQVEGVRELKILQEENARLKKLVAELSLDKAILQDVASKKWNGPR
jgi:putative transposase